MARLGKGILKPLFRANIVTALRSNYIDIDKAMETPK